SLSSCRRGVVGRHDRATRGLFRSPLPSPDGASLDHQRTEPEEGPEKAFSLTIAPMPRMGVISTAESWRRQNWSSNDCACLRLEMRLETAKLGGMFALSLKQPWATLLVHGLKTIEVRRWQTVRRGRVLIHAARLPDDRREAWAHVPPELERAA